MSRASPKRLVPKPSAAASRRSVRFFGIALDRGSARAGSTFDLSGLGGILARALGAGYPIPMPLQTCLLPRPVLGAHPTQAAVFPLVALLQEGHGLHRRLRAQSLVPGFDEPQGNDDAQSD